MTRAIDCLVVASARSRSLAFSCYGRKVEAAIALRKAGAQVAIVHERLLGRGG